MGERLRLYVLAGSEGLRLTSSGLRAALVSILPAPIRPPERLLMAPQDLRTNDATFAADVYAGLFVFAGRLVETRGHSPFEVEPPTLAWAEALAGFGWLRHLRAAESAIARVNARALVDDFLSHEGDRRGIGAQPRVVARRMMSFLSQAPLLLDGADHGFYSRLMRALGRAVAQLRTSLRAETAGEDRLLVAIALAYAGLCLSGPPRLHMWADQQLAAALETDILPDGGHVSRNPRRLVELLTDLLPLRQTYAGRGLEPPIALLTTIDRMMPMLRLFRHGDGALALFNGMGASEIGLLATLLAYDDVRAQAMEHAPYSGYERLAAGRTLLIADVGALPPRMFSREAHAGCLAFELSVGPTHMVVNCGASASAQPAVRLASRTTAAHSTMVIEDVSSCRFAGKETNDPLAERLGGWLGPVVLAGPTRVETNRGIDDGGPTLIASHDGYLRRFGVVHERVLRLAPNGERLDGQDRLLRFDGVEVVPTLRFHLHPGVRASRSQDGQKIMLMLPDGEAWGFEATGHLPMLEESVYFAASEGARRTEQIVVSSGHVDQISWRFYRLGRHQPRQKPAGPNDGGDVLI